MANYVVTTRDKDGSLIERAYTANDRADLFKKLAADGVTAVRIAEGFSGKKPRKAKSSGAPSMGRGIIAAVVVVLGIGVAVWFLMPRGERSAGVKKEEKKVEVKKVEPIKNVTVEKKEEVASTKTNDVIPSARAPVTNGWVRLPNGKMHYRRGLLKTDKTKRPRSRYCIFDHYTDNEFAALLTLKPGDMLLGGAVFPRNYEERFLKSLDTKIEIKDDDPDDIKEVKLAVIQVRKEMKEAYDRGEDIRKTVAEAYEQAQKLAAYKETIDSELRKLKATPNLTEQELDDFVSAANELLGAQGIAPIKIGPLMRAKLLNFKK